MVTALLCDAIENRIIFHYRPGSKVLSVGSFGCNMNCFYCQNYTQAHSWNGIPMKNLSPEEIINHAIVAKMDGIAFSVNEPVVCYEFVMDTFSGAGSMFTALNTNGMIMPEPLSKLLKKTDAMNVDIKSFKKNGYQRLGGNLETVKETIISTWESQTHLEITFPVVRGFNDKRDEIGDLSRWMAKKLSPSVPLHIFTVKPALKFSGPAVSSEIIEALRKEAKKYLDFVYTEKNQDTHCPECGTMIISRKSTPKSGDFSQHCPFFNSVDIIHHDPSCPECGKDLNIANQWFTNSNRQFRLTI